MEEGSVVAEIVALRWASRFTESRIADNQSRSINRDKVCGGGGEVVFMERRLVCLTGRG